MVQVSQIYSSKSFCYSSFFIVDLWTFVGYHSKIDWSFWFSEVLKSGRIKLSQIKSMVEVSSQNVEIFFLIIFCRKKRLFHPINPRKYYVQYFNSFCKRLILTFFQRVVSSRTIFHVKFLSFRNFFIKFLFLNGPKINIAEKRVWRILLIIYLQNFFDEDVNKMIMPDWFRKEFSRNLI